MKISLDKTKILRISKDIMRVKLETEGKIIEHV
jgi:hypothetical protein